MDQAPKDETLGAQASFDSLNGSSDDDAFSEVTGISRRSAGWTSLAGLQGAERNVSRFFRRFIPSHTTAQTGACLVFPHIHLLVFVCFRCVNLQILHSRVRLLEVLTEVGLTETSNSEVYTTFLIQQVRSSR